MASTNPLPIATQVRASVDITPSELAEIELRLMRLPLAERRALADRLLTSHKPRPRSEAAADRLLAFLTELRRRTDVLPVNREIERLSGLQGEDISYLLKVLRRRGMVSVDYPWHGSSDRTFELPW